MFSDRRIINRFVAEKQGKDLSQKGNLIYQKGFVVLQMFASAIAKLC